MPVTATFTDAFHTYLERALTAQAKDQHHDYRRGLFLDFLKDAFSIEADTVDVEKFLRIDLRRKGWIDALFRDVVFEFKRNLDREREDGYRELRDYLRTLEYGKDCVGLLTDGIIFEVYTLDSSDPDKNKWELNKTAIDTIDLRKISEETAFLWLDAYLFSQKSVPPTSADLVLRYGQLSPTFQTAARLLDELLTRAASVPAVAIKRGQWRSVLAKVYGSPDIGSDDLFVRHTFLNQFAKLLAYVALTDHTPKDEDTIQQIITGEAFHQFGVSNLGEIDFFAWVLDEPTISREAFKMLLRLAQCLVVYDLTQINEDLLKQLYQNLVDPVTRHDLGEYYTPDWLAELTLKEINYRPGQSLLDPSCGSGTFLFTAIRTLANQGLTGWELVDFALENIAGMDVHPLAVTVARINYVLAITPHMRGTGHRKKQLAPLPVYMADTLLTVEEKGADRDTLIVPVDNSRDERFKIPADAARAPAVFNEVIDQMDDLARRSIEELNLGLSTSFLKRVKDQFGAVQRGGLGTDVSSVHWGANLKLLNRLISEGRNSIWSFVLKNIARPLLLSAQKFDVIAGNPPWLSYRFIKDRTYQAEVKALYLKYELLKSNDNKLFTQMDLSTLFMVHCEAKYLKENGLIAFVMPRSVITGAKQHRAFQSRGLTRVLDLQKVEPLFNTETAVLIRNNSDLHTENVPTTIYKGRLPTHQLSLVDAATFLKTSDGDTDFVGEVSTKDSYYYDRFKQGAILVPRNLCFVKPQGTVANSPAMMTDPDVNSDSKAPWKGIQLKGLVYEPNLYATLLSKHLLPFGYERMHLVALPVKLTTDNKLKPMSEDDFVQVGRRADAWFKAANEKWSELKQATSQIEDLMSQFNYLQKLTGQTVSGVYKVLYNQNGTHISSCVVDTTRNDLPVYDYSTQGYIVDSKTYSYDTKNILEAHYLCALLNTPSVDSAIKIYQTRGIYKGERDIHRTPFEACNIPPFDPANADHLALAQLSQAAHQAVAQLEFKGGVVAIRRQARAAVESQIAAIDIIAKRILGP